MAVAPLGFTGDGHRGAVTFSRGAGAASPLDVFDVTGRRIAVVLSADGARWLWDGRDASGRSVAPGVVFARARDGVGGAVRLIRL
jgi:hypothetical protein